MKHGRLVFVCASVALAACHPQSDESTYSPWQTRTTAGAERRASSDPEATATSAGTGTETSAATATATTPAGELPTSAITTLAAMLAEERVQADDPVPSAPPEPTIPTAIERRVRDLHTIAERTSDCWMSEPYMRIAHIPPRECPRWFEQLANAGEAGGYAIGQVLATEPNGGGQRFAHLAEILAANGAQSGTPYVLRQIHETLGRLSGDASPTQAQRTRPELPPASALAASVRAFEQITGFPVNETPAWENIYDASYAAKARPMGVRALRFWQRNGAASPSWPSLSEQRLRLWLSADDARVIRAATLIQARRANNNLRAEALQALRRVNSTTSSAEARSYARMAISQLERDESVRAAD
ncbi:MAG: hypothetical protein U0269_15655 [Polyangiales bacterium]